MPSRQNKQHWQCEPSHDNFASRVWTGLHHTFDPCRRCVEMRINCVDQISGSCTPSIHLCRLQENKVTGNCNGCEFSEIIRNKIMEMCVCCNSLSCHTVSSAFRISFHAWRSVVGFRLRSLRLVLALSSVVSAIARTNPHESWGWWVWSVNYWPRGLNVRWDPKVLNYCKSNEAFTYRVLLICGTWREDYYYTDTHYINLSCRDNLSQIRVKTLPGKKVEATAH